MHSGAPVLGDEGYVGLDVHLAARIGATGHGGQIVLVGGRRRAGYRGAGRRARRASRQGFEAPVGLLQVGSEQFPPLKTISNTNLPRPASSFVGRTAEVAALVARVLDGNRLVTLTGPGGSGKTRLAIEAAAELVGDFPAGVFWVELAPLRDPRLVTEAIARMLGAKEELATHIGERRMLLLLDNLEGLTDAGPDLAGLVERCHNLHLLVTSRELLRLRDELDVPVLPLPVRDAAQLFSERSGVAVDATIEELCTKLDNLPLAVELAAARAGVLSAGQILERLGDRLDLFRGARDLDARQQTLRAAIDWSYDLLSDEERRLFAALAVCLGGCTLEAAEEIAGADLDTLEGLVHKSLVRHSGERFWMLATIRDYALERLNELSDATALRRRHDRHYLDLAERAAEALDGKDQGAWLARLEEDYANMRSALANDELAPRFVVALRLFWAKRGYLREGRRLAEAVVARLPDDDERRPGALFTAALLAVMQGDWESARRLAGESRELALAHDDVRTLVESGNVLARALLGAGEQDRALALLEETVRRGEDGGRPSALGIAHLNLGYLWLVRGDRVSARRELEAALEQSVIAEDGHGEGRALAGLASVALEDGQLEESLAHSRRSLLVTQELGDLETLVWALELAGLARVAAQPTVAARLLGSADALRETLDLKLHGLEQRQRERALEQLRDALPVVERETAWSEGAALAADEAVELAL